MRARLRKLLARVHRRLTFFTRGEFPPIYFDIWDLRDLNQLLVAHGAKPVVADPVDAAESVDGATNFVVATVAARPELRSRFPDLFRAGPQGAGALWFTGAGAAELGLSPTAVENIRAAFACYPGEQGLKTYELRLDLRAMYPFALTPKHRGPFLRWAAVHGGPDSGLSIGETMWLLGEMDLRPDRGLATTYRFQPEWQEAVPDALTPAGWVKLKAYIRKRFSIQHRWLKDAELGDGGIPVLPPEEMKRGVNVHGHFDFVSGLQEVALGLVEALKLAGIPTTQRDLPALPRVMRRPDERRHDPERYDTTIFVAGLNSSHTDLYKIVGLHVRPGVKRIAIWYWEQEVVPPELVAMMDWPDEVWAPTRFIADTFRKYVTVPVITMLPGVELPEFAPRPREFFGLAPHRFVFLFVFDMFSTTGRKNPYGLIDAFRRAFKPHEPVDLVIKVSRGSKLPEEFEKLTAQCAAAGVQLRNEVLPRGDLLALMNTCDCYVSLHRSEGLGLGIAETMLMGKPVIATGYSGNLDFMTSETSYLVRYERLASEFDHPPYPKGAVWAEPDLDHAAELMRYVVDHPAEAAATGARAKVELEQLLSMDAYAERVRARIETPRSGS